MQTPMQKQYREIKEKHENELLMFRLGDFYELFGEDAKTASRILNIVLTARHKGTANETPMCGIPHHALNNYLPKLLKAGQRVAICDQVSDASLPGIVKREVVRVITPGTILEDNALQEKSNNYIVSLVLEKNIWGLAIADLTTGDFQVTELADFELLKNELFRLGISEVIVDNNLINDQRYKDFLAELNHVNVFQLTAFNDPESLLLKHFKGGGNFGSGNSKIFATKISTIPSLGAFGVESLKAGITAAGRLLAYLKETQKTDLQHITKIKRYSFQEFMVLDEATIRNLDLFQTAYNADYQGSLLSIIDQTVSNLGGRMLRRWLTLPLLKKEAIEARLNAVQELKDNHNLIKELIEKLKQIADLERLIGRIGCNRTNARDLVALKNSLKLVPEIKRLLNNKRSEKLKSFAADLGEHHELVKLLEDVLLEEPAALLTEGNMIKDGYNQELDELRAISRGGKDWLMKFQAQEIERTKISTLKVKFNRIFGYYIEISNANLNQVPDDYNRRQTLVNAERFITPELKEYEDKILGAEEKINSLEYQIFLETVEKVIQYFVEIQATADIVGQLDVLLNFARLANEHNYCLPEIKETGELKIKNGRHPVIEQFQKEHYVPNDLQMDHQKNEFLLLTGPNMSGKSSYLRQIALISLMAQIGCFVPAEKAELSVVDRIFTRVGASDNLTQGVSTFMAEMLEAANILNHATEKSLIILDELGRGTSTYDGVSIAWAIIEHIHNQIKAKTVFATHYHELTDVVEKLERGENYCVAVSENEGKIVFLHKIIKGASSESYGIEVAKLAGLPLELTEKANQILSSLEKKSVFSSASDDSDFPSASDDSDFPSALAAGKKGVQQESLPLALSPKEKQVVNALTELKVDEMTPLEALQKIVDLRQDLK